jgi:phosphoenolpyruvate-protein kinase (PTS system EI component)
MRGCVVVAAAITPASVLTLQGASAIVAEHGGVLGHAAALARELGIPCVVGCAGVARAVGDGDDLLVDGTAGIVLRLS